MHVQLYFVIFGPLKGTLFNCHLLPCHFSYWVLSPSSEIFCVIWESSEYACEQWASMFFFFRHGVWIGPIVETVELKLKFFYEMGIASAQSLRDKIVMQWSNSINSMEGHQFSHPECTSSSLCWPWWSSDILPSQIRELFHAQPLEIIHL